MLYYQDDHITIYHGDCREIAPTLGRFDLLLTDPPYGIGVDRAMAEKSGTQYGKAAAPKSNYIGSGWDDKPVDFETLKIGIEATGKSVIWGGHYYPVPPARCWFVWDKEINGEFADCELAWTNLNRPVKKFRWMWNGMLRQGQEARNGHPTQKPLELMKWCIEQARDIKTILDPFAGSGTTGRAAKDLGLQCTLIEREERYCEISAKRMQQEVLDLS